MTEIYLSISKYFLLGEHYFIAPLLLSISFIINRSGATLIGMMGITF